MPTLSQIRRHDPHFTRITARKTARTRIYAAVYGYQTIQSVNIPWLDGSRRLPQDHSIELMCDTLRTHWRNAAFSPKTKATILHDVNTLLKSRGHDIMGETPHGGLI